MLKELKRESFEANVALPRHGLINLTFGNASAIDRSRGMFAIKPSGVDYAALTPDDMVLVDLEGNKVEGALNPSSDTPTHRKLFLAFAGIGGVVHTHSPYATAWAAHGLAIPCVLTALADEFGGDIPVGPFARIGGEEIGVGIVATLAEHRSRAVLMRSHGVFTIGADAREALKAAVMCEDAARTALLARTLGELPRLPQEDIDALYDRYQNIYGQR